MEMTQEQNQNDKLSLRERISRADDCFLGLRQNEVHITDLELYLESLYQALVERLGMAEEVMEMFREFVRFVFTKGIVEFNNMEEAEKKAIHSGPFWEAIYSACQRESLRLAPLIKQALKSISLEGKE